MKNCPLRILFIPLALAFSSTLLLATPSFESSATKDFKETKKITEYVAIQRLRTNRYTKGVKYQYHLSQRRNYRYVRYLDHGMSWYTHGAEDYDGKDGVDTDTTKGMGTK